MNHTVLVLEDEDELRETICEALELNGYVVVAAADGVAALEALERVENVCMVLLDLFMPRMNGWDFLVKLRQLPAFAGVPVIVHSSSVSAAPIGVTRILQKPLPFDRLLSVVREYCAEP